MSLDLAALRLEFAAALVLLIIGAATALCSTNVVKRVAGIVIALTAALLALAALGAPLAALSAGVACLMASLALGVALIVRLQEAYGAIELAELDQADAHGEPAEPEA